MSEVVPVSETGDKVDLPTKRTIQHEDTQTVLGRVQGQGRA